MLGEGAHRAFWGWIDGCIHMKKLIKVCVLVWAFWHHRVLSVCQILYMYYLLYWNNCSLL
jgi:hypothetical protein